VPLLQRDRLVRSEHLPAAAFQVAVVDAGGDAQVTGHSRVQSRAVSGEQVMGSARAAEGWGGREDAGTGPRGFLAEIALVEHLDTDAALSEEVRGGQAYDTAAEDQNVRMLCHADVILGALACRTVSQTVPASRPDGLE